MKSPPRGAEKLSAREHHSRGIAHRAGPAKTYIGGIREWGAGWIQVHAQGDTKGVGEDTNHWENRYGRIDGRV